ncbi:hypothetical protein [Chryseolinea serpens]|nr:hypothetical protein [Chryseolinea serpens]
MRRNMLFAAVLFGCVALTAFKLTEGNERGSHEIDAKVKAEVYKVLDDYMNTFNAKNLKAWEATYQFPHHRLASGKMNVLENAGLRDSASVFVPLQKGGWDHSAWDHRNIVQASDTKVHVDTRFSRYKADGSKLGVYESLYILTKENGRWGVKMRSSYAE